jgi:BirA family transcriptional regulator, biotin operon repressor / biotin---[acetyl-CoA-carboxylase] ligase
MIGAPRVHHRSCDSTNERARDLAAAGAPHGTLVTAGEQTAGRGRQGRSWSAPPGSAVLMSLVLRDLDAALPLAAAVAVCEACESVAEVSCSIKWPNDVWIERLKLAGILVEGRPQEGWAVLGMGLNVSASKEELLPTATSLRIATGSHEPGTEAVLGALLEALERRLTDPAEEVIEAWRARDALLGQTVQWTEGEGTAAGIDGDGSLLVETPGGQVALDAGEVHLRA